MLKLICKIIFLIFETFLYFKIRIFLRFCQINVDYPNLKSKMVFYGGMQTAADLKKSSDWIELFIASSLVLKTKGRELH